MHHFLIMYLVVAAMFYVLAVCLQTAVVFTTNDPDTVMGLSKASSVMLMLSVVFLILSVLASLNRY